MFWRRDRKPARAGLARFAHSGRPYFLALVLMMVVSCAVAMAQNTTEEDVSSELKIYSLMEAAPASTGPIAQMMGRTDPLGNRALAVGRPRLIWFHWANQRKPFVPSLLVLLFSSVTFTSLAPRWTANAQAMCRSRFWRTFLFGILALAIGLTCMRVALVTLIGWPLAIFFMAVVELAAICGLSVMVLQIGQAIALRLGADKWMPRADMRRLLCILVGALICAALLQIPGFGILPRIGTRLVALLAVVGVGGLFRTRRVDVEAV